jgi:O-antigen ligase
MAVLVVAWVLLVWGTPAGWLVPWVRIIHVGIMAILIAAWVRALTRGMDAVDAASIATVAAVGVATVTSVIPRLSGDSFFAGVAFAAFFGLVRRIGPGIQQLTTKALLVVLIVFSVAFVVLWATAWIEWTRATGLAPSLEMNLASGPFGQRHNVATLIALLVPAALMQWGAGTTWRGLLLGVLFLAAVAIFMSGGRAVWLAAAVASMAALASAGLVPRASGWLWERRVAISGAALALCVLTLASGAAGALLERVLTTSSLGMRGAIWGSTLEVWKDQPLTGWGPGVFAFGLQASDYFDRSVFSPRHADNLYVQTLGELGIVGALCLVAVLAAIIRTWRPARPSPHIVWALVFAAVVGIGTNPAALGYCAIPITFWAGTGARWDPFRRPPMPRWVGVAAPALLVIVASVPLVTTAAATLAFDQARRQADVGALDAAVLSLDEAVHFDPEFSLYRRERGILLLRHGRPAEATSELKLAALQNPLDDTTHRALALISIEGGRIADALSSARTAAELRATDPMNQAVLAIAADAAEHAEERDTALARLVAIAPWSTADTAWTAAYPGVQASAALDDAAAMVAAHPLADTVDQRWTLALAGSPGVTQTNGFSAAQEAFAHVVACRLPAARDVLEQVPTAGRNDEEFWFAWAVLLGLSGEEVEAIALPGDPLTGPALGDPAVDAARYARRSPQPWNRFRLPSNTGGRTTWLQDPNAALRLVRHTPCA